MYLRYEQLFNIGFTAAYYVDGRPHDDFIVEPTRNCMKQMSRYRILFKQTLDGIALLYECNPSTNDATPFKPITTEEKFLFKVSVTNPDTWYYADINNWEKDKVYLLKNAVFNTTGNINILAGALNNAILFRPMHFMYEVLLDSVQSLLEIRNDAGNIIRTIIVRAKTAGEPVGKKESYFINLQNFTDGLYTIRHVSTAGNIDEDVYCTVDYATGTLAIIEIKYKTGVAYTGVAPFQKYIINVSSRLTDWLFDVHIRKKPFPTILASQLSIKHIPTPSEPLQTFSTVGVPDDVNGYVQFKSNAKLSYSQKPMHLQLLKSPATSILDPLPLPSSLTVQKDALNNLFTKIIVNM